MEIHVQVETDTRDLRALAAVLADWRPLWPLVTRLARGWLRKQVESQGEWGGTRWEPLSADYAAWKARRFPGRPLMVRTAFLRESMYGRRGVVPHPSPRELVLEIPDPKAEWHQTGAGRLPVRELVPARLPRAAETELAGLVEKYFDDALRRFGS